MADKIISVLVVDDHLMVRKGLATFLSGFPDLELAGEAESLASALQAYQATQPDVVLMDMMLPDGTGAQAIAAILAADPHANIIALTSLENDEVIEDALRAGARAFFLKTVGVHQLAEAIRVVSKGGALLEARATQVLQRLMSAGADDPAPDTVMKSLSERERAVLGLLVQGLTNKQIAAEMNIQLSTVKQYMGSILSKLGARSRTEAVATALRLGLV
jgi:DNA-binding NarL/FixJ family response regulator